MSDEMIQDELKKRATLILDLQTKINDLEDMKKSMTDEIVDLRTQNKLGNRELIARTKELAECRDEVGVLNESLQVAKDKLMQRDTDADDVKSELETTVTALNLVSIAHNDLKDKLRDAQDEIENLKGQLFLANQSNEKLHQEAAVMSREFNLAREAFREATSDCIDVEATKAGVEELVELCTTLREAVLSYTGYTSLGVPNAKLEVATRLPKIIRLLWARMDGAWR